MRRAFYTINFGNYDPIRIPDVITPGWDYYVFTDKDINLPPYKVIKVDTGLPVHLQARDCYINSQKYLPEYDLTIMIGGQVKLRGNLNEIIQKCDLSCDINTFRHHARNCIYQEAQAVINIKYDSAERVTAQMNKYRTDGMPENYGLAEHGMIIRKRGENIKRHEELWWEEVTTYSHRDQLSFMYILWKHKLVTVNYLPFELIQSKWLGYYYHGTNKEIKI
jgi:hypothetical protein